MEVFFKTADRDVLAVIIGGLPIYGDRDFLGRFDLDLQRLPSVEGHAVENKSVHLPTRLGVDLEQDVDELEAAFKRQGVKRSNLLASSDTPYRHRIARLKKYITDYAWSVQRQHRRRRKGLESTAARVPVPPDAVRVWRGFKKRQSGFEQQAFVRKLTSLFIPSVAPFQAPLGLTAYVPAIIPPRGPACTPDEIALVFYESQDTYRATFDSIAGRAYGDLHATVFEFADSSYRSTSAWPVLFSEEAKPGQPYHLFSSSVDWQRGHVNVVVATRPPETNPEEFLARLADSLGRVQQRHPQGLDGAIFVGTEDYFCYWEHWDSSDPADGERPQPDAASAIPNLLRFADPQLNVRASTITAAQNLFESNAGLDEIVGGAAFNVQFHRRRDYENLT
jgi:hypothetical protein